MGKRTTPTRDPAIIEPDHEDETAARFKRQRPESSEVAAMTLLSIKDSTSTPDIERPTLMKLAPILLKQESDASSITDDEDDIAINTLSAKSFLALKGNPPVTRALGRPPSFLWMDPRVAPKPKNLLLPLGRPLPPAPSLPKFFKSDQIQPLANYK